MTVRWQFLCIRNSKYQIINMRNMIMSNNNHTNKDFFENKHCTFLPVDVCHIRDAYSDGLFGRPIFDVVETGHRRCALCQCCNAIYGVCRHGNHVTLSQRLHCCSNSTV